MPLTLLLACGDLGLADTLSDGKGGEITVEPSGVLDFGSVSQFADHPGSLTVTVVSSGYETIEVSDARTENANQNDEHGDNGEAFYVGALPFPREIEPGMEIPFDVKFMPSHNGTFRGNLVIEIANGSTLSRPLEGNGCNDEDRDGQC